MSIDIRRVVLSELSPDARRALIRRSAVPDPALRAAAADIVAGVRRDGDTALREYNRRFGGGSADGRIAMPQGRIDAAAASIDPEVRRALEAAADNIRRGHEPQKPTDQSLEVQPGVKIDRRWSPLRRIGAYVPGGTAAYPSSLLMAVIPAQIAGVAEIVVVSPAAADGEVSPTLLAAAGLLGITEMYVTGGAQAIAALAYGTESIRPVTKIVGPGNAWVTAAKLAVYGEVGIDLPAGPSEAIVVADASADPLIVAADLICQAEHGPDSPVTLITPAAALVTEVVACIDRLLPALSRADTIVAALEGPGMIITTDGIDQALEFADDYAPEHLTIHTETPEAHADRVTGAGSIFVGHWSPESAGDYATGANHILPTGGLGQAYGPLGVEDFGSWRQVQRLTRFGLERLRPTIVALASAEGLTAHRLATELRFDPKVAR